MRRDESSERAYIRYLYGLRSEESHGNENRGALAKLRRGLGKPPGSSVEMYPIVVPYLPDNLKPRELEAYFLVGSLFGLCQDVDPDDQHNMGAVFRELGDHESARKRFVALLDTEWEQLPVHLRQAVSLAKSQRIPINFRVLLRDLLDWENREKRVQLSWARSYWSRPSGSESETGTKSSSQETAK